MEHIPFCTACRLTLLLLMCLVPAVSVALPQQPFEVPPGIVMEKDLAYAEVDGHTLRLDVFYPKDAVEPLLGVLFVHGERPQGRDKTHYWPMAAALATRGFVAATIEYRNVRQARYPAAVDDVKAAAQWLRKNAARYHLDPRKIGAVGENFGGYLVSMLGAAGTVEAVSAIHPVTDLPAMITALAPNQYPYGYALFLGFPLPQRPQLWKDASPVNRVGAKSAPFLLFHGVNDNSIPYQQSVQMKAALEKAGVRAELLSAEGAGNLYLDAPDAQRRAAMQILQFFLQILWEPPDDVAMVKDLVYAERDGHELRLDLFLPKSGAGPFPAIIFVHGGGWLWGDKTDHRREAAELARKGFVTACIEYRLTREHIYPAQVDDVKEAIRWVRANARQYRIQPDRIGAAGSSSGGQLVALMGVTPEKSHYVSPEPYPGISASVQAVAAFCAPVDLVEQFKQDGTAAAILLGSVPRENPGLWAEASPINHVGSGAAPFLFLHGTKDKLVPYQEVLEMLGKLKSVGVQAELFAAEGGNHDFLWDYPWRPHAFKAMEEFFIRVLKK